MSCRSVGQADITNLELETECRSSTGSSLSAKLTRSENDNRIAIWNEG